MNIHALIVDDEPLARDMIRELLKRRDDIAVLGECENGLEAVEAIRRWRPDLVFLDVQMPELDGFAVLRQLEDAERPEIVFVTAHDKYAIAAFEVNALDYLLKPFTPDRFEQAVDRAVGDLARRGTTRQDLAKLLEHLDARERNAPSDRLAVRDAGRITFLKTNEVDWIEAARDYACIHAGNKTYVMQETMARLESILDRNGFVRIHRSTIVSLDRVAAVETDDLGECFVLMRDQRRLRVSRSCREKLLQRMGVG